MKVAIFDTETTGLVKTRALPLEKQPEIIEFYAVQYDLKKGKRLKTFSTLIEPKKSIPDEITKINRIDDKMVEGKPDFGKVFSKIAMILERTDAIIAHNLKFDIDMLEIEAERLGKKFKWPRKICTVEATFSIKGHRMRLNQLYEYLFNESFDGAHRAEADVEALLRCVIELHKREII